MLNESENSVNRVFERATEILLRRSRAENASGLREAASVTSAEELRNSMLNDMNTISIDNIYDGPNTYTPVSTTAQVYVEHDDYVERDDINFLEADLIKTKTELSTARKEIDELKDQVQDMQEKLKFLLEV